MITATKTATTAHTSTAPLPLRSRFSRSSAPALSLLLLLPPIAVAQLDGNPSTSTRYQTPLPRSGSNELSPVCRNSPPPFFNTRNERSSANTTKRHALDQIEYLFYNMPWSTLPHGGSPGAPRGRRIHQPIWFSHFATR